MSTTPYNNVATSVFLMSSWV